MLRRAGHELSSVDLMAVELRISQIDDSHVVHAGEVTQTSSAQIGALHDRSGTPHVVQSGFHESADGILRYIDVGNRMAVRGEQRGESTVPDS